MATKLINLKIKEISLVDEGANPGAKVLFTKRNEVKKMTPEEYEAEIQRLTQENAALVAQIQQAATEPAPEEKAEEEVPVVEEEQEEEKACGGDHEEEKMEAPMMEEEEEETEDEEKSFAKALKSLPEPLAKFMSELKKRNQELEKAAKIREWSDKCAPLSVIGDVSAIAKNLYQIEKSNKEAAQIMFETMKSAAGKIAVSKSKGFEEIGKSYVQESATALDALNKKADEIRNSEPKLSPQQAFAKAVSLNPDLYRKYQSER